ncbi:histone H1-like repetitive region-containing protein [Nannocystis pusilla]|uniref:histone H1-like repetitive region-containing protein n=1 Tax=Nannocystis pusilla TaxID=889268 RepID=UPI003BF3CED4
MTTPDEFAFRKAVFYFRTLDRWPGGNADMITIKVVLRLAPGAAPELTAQFYRCFDGRHLWYPARGVVVDAGDALAEFLAVTRSLAARGSSIVAAHVLDPAEDEWDCDWADSEVYLHATDDAPETEDGALLQLVRRTSKAAGSPPDPELERAFELARQITGVGRVFQFGNTEDALSAAYWGPDGAPEQELEYAAEAAPSYLPPETDAVFLELQAVRAQIESQAAAKAAEARGPETLLVYRLDEVPEFLTRDLPPDSSVRRCLFFTARDDSPAIDAMLAAIPEDEHADVDAAMEIAHRVTAIAARSEAFANTLRPDEVPRGGALIGGTYVNGFHGGDAEAVERWIEAQGLKRVPLRSFLDRLILLRALDEAGAPLEQVDKFAGGPPALTADPIDDDGLYVFERDSDHVRFELAQVSDEEEVPWLELRAEDLPPGVLHTVTVPAVSAEEKTGAQAADDEPAEEETEAAAEEETEAAAEEETEAAEPEETASRKTPAKKAAKRAAAKKSGAKKSASKKTAAKKPAAKKTASKKPAKAGKKTAAKKPAAKKTAAKKPAAKKPASKKTAKKSGAKKSGAKKPAAKKTASKKTAKAGKKSVSKKPASKKTAKAGKKSASKKPASKKTAKK